MSHKKKAREKGQLGAFLLGFIFFGFYMVF